MSGDKRTDAEKRIIASLADPKTSSAALETLDKLGIDDECFSDNLGRDFYLLAARGIAPGYINGKPVKGFADISADCIQLKAEFEKRNPKPTCIDAADWLGQPDEADDPLIDGLIEVGSMVAIVGPAKAAKSHLAEEVAVCLAAGVDFLGHKVKRQVVYVANVEVSAKQYKKRLRAICRGLSITPADLRGRLFVDNLRGNVATWDAIRKTAADHRAQVIIIDPFYQVFKGKETDEGDCLDAVEEMKKFLATGVSLFVVFHAPKGYSGDRQVVDMISGSSVLVRFPENVIAILPHAEDKLARVVDCSVLRDHVAPDPFSVKFSDGALVPAPDIEPVLKSGRMNRKGRTQAEIESGKVKLQNERDTGMMLIAKAFLDRCGDNIPGVQELSAELRKHHPKGVVEVFIKDRRADGTFATNPQMRWDADAKTWKVVGARFGGKTLISTPQRVEAYRAKVSTFPVA